MAQNIKRIDWTKFAAPQGNAPKIEKTKTNDLKTESTPSSDQAPESKKNHRKGDSPRGVSITIEDAVMIKLLVKACDRKRQSIFNADVRDIIKYLKGVFK